MVDFFKRDSLRPGVVAGIAVPVVLFVAAVLLLKKGMGIGVYLQTMMILGSLSKIMSLCVYPNLAIFYLYLHFKRDTAAKGVVWGTLVMAVVVAAVYFIQKSY